MRRLKTTRPERRRSRRWAAAFLAAGLLLAVCTPAYVAHAAPDLAGYLLHPSIFLLQALPYLVCAVVWVPKWAPGNGTPSVVLSAVLLLVAFVLYVPVVWAPSSRGGDMIGLAFVAISMVTTAAVVVASAATMLVLRLRHREAVSRDSRRVAP